ncbi:MAG TPA: cyclophilin-like fold protein [Bacteroidales bacterium]
MKKVLFAIIIYFGSMLSINAQESVKIKITVGANSFVATLFDNATAKAFMALLPMSITMNELNGNEKYYFLSNNLPSTSENPSTIQNGDLMLYGSNCIVLFYETFNTSYSYTKIGKIYNPTGLKTALGSQNPSVTFELIGNTTGIGSIQPNINEIKISNDGLLQFTGYAKKISLLDINGRILTNTTSQTINMNSFSKGIYFLKIEGTEQSQSRTIKLKY